MRCEILEAGDAARPSRFWFLGGSLEGLWGCPGGGVLKANVGLSRTWFVELRGVALRPHARVDLWKSYPLRQEGEIDRCSAEAAESRRRAPPGGRTQRVLAAETSDSEVSMSIGGAAVRWWCVGARRQLAGVPLRLLVRHQSLQRPSEHPPKEGRSRPVRWAFSAPSSALALISRTCEVANAVIPLAAHRGTCPGVVAAIAWHTIVGKQAQGAFSRAALRSRMRPIRSPCIRQEATVKWFEQPPLSSLHLVQALHTLAHTHKLGRKCKAYRGRTDYEWDALGGGCGGAEAAVAEELAPTLVSQRSDSERRRWYRNDFLPQGRIHRSGAGRAELGVAIPTSQNSIPASCCRCPSKARLRKATPTPSLRRGPC